MVSNYGARSFIVIIPLLYCASYVHTQEIALTIPLNGTTTYDNRELYHEFRTLKDSTLIAIKFSDINETLKFIVFQVHSHIHNVTIFTNYDDRDKVVIGTNVGLLSFKTATDIIYLQNTYNVTQRVYISVHGYYVNDTIPGGCSSDWEGIDMPPYLRALTTKDYVIIDAPDASLDVNCYMPLLTNITIYMMYLPEMNFYPDVYFDGIRKMMTLKGILQYGKIIRITNHYMVNRRVVSTYPGTGAIYAAISNFSGYYSVYVPTHTYGCWVSDEDGCDIIDDALSQVLCGFLFFVGILVCFFGHRYFKTEMFISGLFAGVIISYICFDINTSLDTPALLAASSISGVFFGATWLLLWWLYGIPVISVLLPSMELGFLISSIFYYSLPSEVMYLEDDFNFWSLFCFAMCLTALALVSMTFAANILCCAVLGAYASVTALDFYMGSSLKFIIINIIRRAAVPGFNKAVLMAPFQWRDLVVVLAWSVLATSGFMVQHWYNRGRPPFPPPPRNTRPTMDEPYYYDPIVNYNTIGQTRNPATSLGEGTSSNATLPRNTLPRNTTERTPLLG